MLGCVCNQEHCVKAVGAARQLDCLGNARIYKAGELQTEKKERERERPDDTEAHPLDSIQLKWARDSPIVLRSTGPTAHWSYSSIH